MQPDSAAGKEPGSPAKRPELARLASPTTGCWDPHFLAHRKLFATLERVAAYAQGALLDIGCGNKPYEAIFGPRVKSYTGCDVAQSSRQRVDVLCEATSIPLPDAAFDTVISTQTIEHVADHRAAIAEAARLLRPGGVLILSGPMYWCLHEEPYDFFRFTPYGFQFLLRNAGLTVVELLPNGGPWSICGLALIHAFQGTRLRSWKTHYVINWLFSKLDDHSRSVRDSSNYVVVARKPASP